MAKVITRTQDDLPVVDPITEKGLQATLEKRGRLPSVQLLIRPLDTTRPTVVLDKFLDYSFSSSIVVPVDAFSFSFVTPESKGSLIDEVREGDIVQLLANGVVISTGLIDSVEIETDNEFGERVEITGRDLMGQLEDQDAVSLAALPVWGNAVTIAQVIGTLSQATRVKTPASLQSAPVKAYLFATEPGESKLSALQRYLEPLNCLAWMLPDGRIRVGRPNMSQPPSGLLSLNRTKRQSNVTGMSVVYASATIPNIIVPIWTGQETVQARVPPSQQLLNTAKGPARLRKLGHLLPKAVVASTPQGTDAQSLSDINLINASKAGDSTLLQALAKREIARQNMREMIVKCTVPGHYNERGQPFLPDTTYKIEYERGGVDEVMYLYDVGYTGSEGGQKTTLQFCRLGTIVADVRAP